MQTITVHAPDKTYPIHLGHGLLADLPQMLTERQLYGQPCVVTNTTLEPIYGRQLAERLNAALVTLPDGEAYKTLDSVRALYDQFVAAKLDRRSVIIGLGGGVLGDMAGFAAATYLRGMPFVQIPTSLLAMVDSSVGGKVGVDLPQGKNLVGAFKQPDLVLIDTALLDTLPDVEFRCGLAEVVKAGLIREPSLLDAPLDRANAEAFIARAVQIKVAVVEADPYEQNIRAYLNLGHTFGHALEQVSGYTWKHGEAVALGLVAAARLSAAQGLCSAELPAQVESILLRLGLPVRYSTYEPQALRAAMDTDKKRAAGRVRFVLLREAGDPMLSDDVPDARVIEVLASLRV